MLVPFRSFMNESFHLVVRNSKAERIKKHLRPQNIQTGGNALVYLAAQKVNQAGLDVDVLVLAEGNQLTNY